MYDQFGREGLNGGLNSADGGPAGNGPFGGFAGPGGHRFGRHRHRHPFDDDLDGVFGMGGGAPPPGGVPHFVFRDPFDVFRDFFGGHDPFEELLDRKQSETMTDRVLHYRKQFYFSFWYHEWWPRQPSFFRWCAASQT